MGAVLAAEAAVKFSDVGYDAYRVLIWMSLQALDKENDRGQPPRLFYGGRETLATIMRPGLPPPTDDSKEARARWRNAYRDLQAAMETLVAVGAVARVGGQARDGNRQTWKLTLTRKAGRSERQERKRLREAARRKRLREQAQGGTVPHPKDGTVPHPLGDSAPPSARDSAPPLGHIEDTAQERREDTDGGGRLPRTGNAHAWGATDDESDDDPATPWLRAVR